MIKIAPSLLAADFLNLKDAAEMIERSAADWYHLDVMDGVFVPNISFGLPVIKALNSISKKPLDVHLMITQPERYISDFKKAGANYLTVHVEACNHLHRTLQMIKDEGMYAGVAINPHTPLSSIEYIIEEVDLICLMSVNPGFGGQHFIEHTYSKIQNLVQLRKAKNAKALIEIDGGVTFKNAKQVIECGADVLVAGNTVFSHPNSIEAIHQLKHL